MITNIAKKYITKYNLIEPFYIVDYKKLDNIISQWKQYLPNITPFYAIKCNPNRNILKYMIKKDVRFDCASKKEIETIIKLFKNKDYEDKIIYSHPVKNIKNLKFAYKNNITHTVFDTFTEIDKIKEYASSIKCLIRLQIDNPDARIQLGTKFGVNRDEYKELLDYAKSVNLNVVGVAFHIGSANSNPYIYHNAFDFSNDVIYYAKSLGFNIELLDIGGGFTTTNFRDSAKIINVRSDEFIRQNINVIAEPGRLYAETAFTFFTPVIGYRYRNCVHNYYISDSLYGSFNCINNDDFKPTFEVLKNPLNKQEFDNRLLDSYIFFETCDSIDKYGEVKLPKLEINDFLMIENFGSYTLSGSTNFNGLNMTHPKIYYINK